MRTTLRLLVALVLVSCAEPRQTPPGGGPGGGAPDGGAAPSDDGATAPPPGPDGGTAHPEAGTPGDGGARADDAGGPCVAGERLCAGPGVERECVATGGSTTWSERACAPLEHCLTDRCAPACLDECALGETRTAGSGRESCQLYSTDAGGFVAAGDGAHDRARRHLAWLRAHHLANGYVANVLFADAAHSTPLAYTGTVDAAEWTGVYLAAEALRALATGSPDATRDVEQLIERVHQLFAITGAPGYMARIWAPLGVEPLLDALYDPTDRSHFRTRFGGGEAFYQAWTSRDMYAGVALGLGLAYDATRSATHRALVREVVVTLARELVLERRGVPVRIRHHLLGAWQETDLAFDMRHVVLVPDEMVDGRVFIQVGSDADPSSYDASELRGAREFEPDLRTILGQTPVVGALLPSIPRPSSAMMMANFMELALRVTDGVPGSEADHELVRAHYEASKAEWLALMRQYAYHNESECWRQYFGLTIAHHPIYGVLRLTEDTAYRTAIQADVLGARMRPFVQGHANTYFDFIAASQGAAGVVPSGELATTIEQLRGFVAPPKAAVAVDHRGDYPASADCPGQSSVPVAIADRVPVDFLWQHHPFRLVNDQVDPRHVYPGTDYLVAYWMGRYHDLVPDDAPGTCTRWRPE